MPIPAPTAETTRRFGQTASALLAWHDRRPRATMSSPRGWLWAALVAASFFWMSNPLVLVPAFSLSLAEVIQWTIIVALVTLPWLRLPRIPWPWLLFLGLCLLSQLWTISDVHTDLANVLYLKITALAVVVAANCSPQVVAWGMGLGGVAVVALSYYAYQAEMPGTSNAVNGGAEFTGVGTNENILAYTLAISLAATLAIGPPRHVAARLAWSLVLGVQAYGLYLANSGTGYLAALSIVVVGLSIFAWPTIRRAGRRTVLGWITVLSLIPLLGLLVVTVALGKELSTLSGRTSFWDATIDATLHHSPVIGSGWGAVWAHPWSVAEANDVAAEIYAATDAWVPHGHNFFIDVLPELGLLGVLAVVVMVGYTVRSVHVCGLLADSADPAAGRLVLTVLVVLLVSGLTEPMLTVPLGWWSLALVVAVARQRDLDTRPETARGMGSRPVGRHASRTDDLVAGSAG